MAVHLDPLPSIRPLTVGDYRAMHAAGIITDEDHLELIDGFLVEREIVKPPHIEAVMQLNMLAVPAAASAGHYVFPQLPREVDDDLSLPQPDIAIGPRIASGERAPRDAVLVIEVADSSLRFDLGRKAQIYAKAGVPEYWVLDIGGRCLHVLTEPENGAFGRSVVHAEHAPVTADRIPLTVRVGNLLLNSG